MSTKSTSAARLDRRAVLAGATGMAGLALASKASASAVRPRASGKGAFPQGFLWGVATAAHQVEGGNTSSDFWLLENLKPSLFHEPSGDACDHYHRYRDDMALVKALGFNTYRFSIEWARVEPEKGFYSLAALDHYRRMLAHCHELGLTPVLTLHHFTAPRWFATEGGWENDASSEYLGRYAERVAKHLGDLIAWAVTVNEPNTAEAMAWKAPGGIAGFAAPFFAAAAKHCGSDKFTAFPFGDALTMQRNLIAGHKRALAAMKSGPGRYPIGPALAITDDRPDPSGDTSGRDRKRSLLYQPWFDAIAGCDYIGVQTYTGGPVGKTGDLPPAPGQELTQMDYPFAPEALGATVRYAHQATGLPVLITENGIGTEDDTRRAAYIKIAVHSVLDCLSDGVDVRGYTHWSLLDNFEWDHGYVPKFGLVAVNRTTFERKPKPSAKMLGAIARANRLA